MVIDTRLVAKVQTKAGRLVHETAQILQVYYFAHGLWKVETDPVAKAKYAKQFQDAEIKLRQFLTKP